jgi:hypothetical protein
VNLQKGPGDMPGLWFFTNKVYAKIYVEDFLFSTDDETILPSIVFYHHRQRQ